MFGHPFQTFTSLIVTGTLYGLPRERHSHRQLRTRWCKWYRSLYSRNSEDHGVCVQYEEWWNKKYVPKLVNMTLDSSSFSKTATIQLSLERLQALHPRYSQLQKRPMSDSLPFICFIVMRVHCLPGSVAAHSRITPYLAGSTSVTSTEIKKKKNSLRGVLIIMASQHDRASSSETPDLARGRQGTCEHRSSSPGRGRISCHHTTLNSCRPWAYAIAAM